MSVNVDNIGPCCQIILVEKHSYLYQSDGWMDGWMDQDTVNIRYPDDSSYQMVDFSLNENLITGHVIIILLGWIILLYRKIFFFCIKWSGLMTIKTVC
jgi:hypothetical protein